MTDLTSQTVFFARLLIKDMWVDLCFTLCWYVYEQKVDGRLGVLLIFLALLWHFCSLKKRRSLKEGKY